MHLKFSCVILTNGNDRVFLGTVSTFDKINGKRSQNYRITEVGRALSRSCTQAGSRRAGCPGPVLLHSEYLHRWRVHLSGQPTPVLNHHHSKDPGQEVPKHQTCERWEGIKEKSLSSCSHLTLIPGTSKTSTAGQVRGVISTWVRAVHGLWCSVQKSDGFSILQQGKDLFLKRKN